MDFRIAVAIPCQNEAVAIAGVIKDFRAVLPEAEIYAFDNGSTDQSRELAREAGAKVEEVFVRGKGNVVRAIFDALAGFDAVVMVDGDGTYDAGDAARMIEVIREGRAQMAVGHRLMTADPGAFRSVRQFGNHLITRVLNFAFGSRLGDVLSGYRVMSREFLRRIPVMTRGFEVETELTVQALQQNMKILEVPVSYRSRPQNSHSKLSPWRDGWVILFTMVLLLRDHQPLRVYGWLGLGCWLLAGWAGVMKWINCYTLTPFTDSLLAGLILLFAPLGAIMFAIGFIVSAIQTRVQELRQLMYRQNRYPESRGHD